MSRKRISETSDLSFDDFDEVHYPAPARDRLRAVGGAGRLAAELPRRERRLRGSGVRRERRSPAAPLGPRRRPLRVRSRRRQHPRHGHRPPRLQLARGRPVGGSDVVERGRVRPGDPRHRREPGARLRRQQRRHGALRPRWPERPRGQQRVREPQDHLRRGREREPCERRRRAQGQGRPRGVGGGDREPRRHVGRSSRTPLTTGRSPRTPRWRSPVRRVATTCSRPPPTRTG